MLEFVNFLAALLLLIAFAMLAQRREFPLINLFALQGLVLSISTFSVAFMTGKTIFIFRPP